MSLFQSIYQNYGTAFDSQHWRSLNFCGLLGVSASFFLHFYAFVMLGWYHVLIPIKNDNDEKDERSSSSIFGMVIFIILYIPCCILAIWSLYMAWSTDPGAVPMGARPLLKHHPKMMLKKKKKRKKKRDGTLYEGPNYLEDDGSGGAVVVCSERTVSLDDDDDDGDKKRQQQQQQQQGSTILEDENESIMMKSENRRGLLASESDGTNNLDNVPAGDEEKSDNSPIATNNISNSHNYDQFHTEPPTVSTATTQPIESPPVSPIKQHTYNTTTNNTPIQRCEKCLDNYKPPRAHHSHITGRCIIKLDHYCPWIGNAVGALNHKFFVLFILYTLLTSILSGVLLILEYVSSCKYDADDSDDDTASNDDGRYLTVIFVTCPGNSSSSSRWPSSFSSAMLLCETIWFFFVSLIMLINQRVAIVDNISLIAQKKLVCQNNNNNNKKKQKSQSNKDDVEEEGGQDMKRVTNQFNEMFGGNTNRIEWHWFLPLPVVFPDGMRDVVLGYRWDPSYGYGPWDEDDVEEGVGGDSDGSFDYSELNDDGGEVSSSKSS